jgi:hypothetical protein
MHHQKSAGGCTLDGRWSQSSRVHIFAPVFIQSAGWRSAVIYTFVEQVRSHGADPYAYFEWVFEKLMHEPSPSAEQVDHLLPTAWLQQTRQSKIA